VPKGRATSTLKKPPSTVRPVAIPPSLGPKLEAALDAWQECEGDDDHCVVKADELPYSRDPAAGADRLLEALRAACHSPTINERLESLRPALVARLRTTSLDDSDAATMLEWLMAHGNIAFVARERPAKALDLSGPQKSYSPSSDFMVGDVVAHPKFGPGKVIRRLDDKVEIQFQDETRTLAATTRERG